MSSGPLQRQACNLVGRYVRTHKLDFHILKEFIRKRSFYRVVEQCLNCSIARLICNWSSASPFEKKRKQKMSESSPSDMWESICINCQHAGIRKSCLLLSVGFYFSLVQLLLITINYITWLIEHAQAKILSATSGLKAWEMMWTASSGQFWQIALHSQR